MSFFSMKGIRLHLTVCVPPSAH